MSLLSPDAFLDRLRDVGARRYHDRHPFHRRLHSGLCSKGEVQAWALNRYAYQAAIPRKDATLIARLDDPALRRDWRQRLVDHDGGADGEGGIERWLRLCESLGFARADVVAFKGVLPATRFAVGAYIEFVRERPLLEAVASSLTELFSPQVIKTRVAGMLAHYDFVSAESLSYFTARPEQASRDVESALAYVREHAATPAAQEAVVAALEFKCDVLWAMLDALDHAYGEAGQIPPGAFEPVP
ncbi:MAG TPA: pyrroloquinoline-quinone synthase PqqC [Bosea sp. (in: a-proteobacteria)]|uniref:pyrroloquinoline-quinone synthase PqqC n=1 Tax=Bosea sp. (in: a-proteobacteria) TaxID=1871050 RepID=UPI002DDD7029|nr:pyrroloquinoline-quinone synthase PqqC [Bosea sp. (in: a-proteobacteria)]HEV2553509.1 pyrroloquinoline-quinone synthase PqqC [Bosea sp. (in: a-proteobacteria)]